MFCGNCEADIKIHKRSCYYCERNICRACLEVCDFCEKNFCLDCFKDDSIDKMIEPTKCYDCKKTMILLMIFRRKRAARIITQACHNWVWKPICNDGKMGVRIRLDIAELGEYLN